MSRIVKALRQVKEPTNWANSDLGGVSEAVRSAGTTYETSLNQGDDDTRLDRQTRRLVDAISQQFPPDSPTALLITGVGSISHIADVAGRIARQLTLVGSSDVVLVDAEPEQKVLTQRFAATTECGLAESIRDSLPIDRFAMTTAVQGLRFIPFGGKLNSRQLPARDTVREMIRVLKCHWPYVVFAAGGEPNALASALSRYCDGTYLVVQVGAATRVDTEHRARDLVAVGARLLGAVATGVRRPEN